MELPLKRLDEYWYQPNLVSLILTPVSWIFRLLVALRRYFYNIGLLNSTQMPVPVIIIGNITVGGSGKTPLIIALVKLLKHAGYLPGVISRGYGGKASSWPQQVRADSDPQMVGDEPVLISQNCDVPMAVGPDRVAAAEQLLKYHDCDVILSDDGLQHYALKRDIEMVVIDGIRRFGNGLCLPAGPLREPQKRLSSADFIVTNGLAMRMEYPMQLEVYNVINLKTGKQQPLSDFAGKTVHAVAGIGNPDRFFNQLKKKQINVITHPFIDHFAFSANDLEFQDDIPVFMTEKDAVKCQQFVTDNMWVVPVQVKLDERLSFRLLSMLKKLY
ncbi:MAG: tetraacyldisaccharide 4'-kinase [Gammaproteobacteria bacterium]|nr:tetraacyldisaccharide 4'-kinase [Gammaproteobacteria bacterium]